MNKDLLSLLYGTHRKAKKVKTDQDGENIAIYELNDKIYIRTNSDLIFSAPSSVAKLGDRSVYEIGKTRSINLSQNGKTMIVKILR